MNSNKHDMEPLEESSIHEDLNGKVKVLGVHFTDILTALGFSAVGNFIAPPEEHGGGSLLTMFLVLILPVLVLIFLILLRRTKSEHFLKDVIKYGLKKGFLSAGGSTSETSGVKKENE